MVDPIALLKKKQGSRSQRQLAREIGISAAFLTDVYLGRRGPGPKILGYLGLERIVTRHVTYRRRRA